MPTGSISTSEASRCEAMVAISAAIQPPSEAPTRCTRGSSSASMQIEVVERQIGDVLDPLGRRRAGVAGMARRDHVEALGQLLLEAEPPPARARAVQIEQRRARAGPKQIHGRVADHESWWVQA